MGGNTSTSFGGGNQATGKLSSSFQPQYGQGYSPLPQQYQYGYNPAQQYQHYQPQPSYTPQHAALSNALANIPSFLQGSGVLQGNAAQQVQSVAQQAAQSAQPAPAAAPALNPAMSPMPMQLGSSGQNVPTMPTQMASYAANNFSPPAQLGSSGGQPPSAMPTQTEMRDALAKAATSLASQQSSPMPMQLGSVGMGAFNAGAPTQTASMNSLGNRLASGSLRALNPPSQPSSLQSASISPEASVFRQFQNQQAGLPQTQAPVQAPPPGM